MIQNVAAAFTLLFAAAGSVHAQAESWDARLAGVSGEVTVLAADGSPGRAAVMLGVSRQTVHTWMRKHEIRVERRVVAA